jgi:hypothetical protein
VKIAKEMMGSVCVVARVNGKLYVAFDLMTWRTASVEQKRELESKARAA